MRRPFKPNRACYNAYYVPLEYLSSPQWPPTYIACDCGGLAKHIVHFTLLPGGAPRFEETRIWECPDCGKKYSLPIGTLDFLLVEEEGKSQ